MCRSLLGCFFGVCCLLFVVRLLTCVFVVCPWVGVLFDWCLLVVVRCLWLFRCLLFWCVLCVSLFVVVC